MKGKIQKAAIAAFALALAATALAEIAALAPPASVAGSASVAIPQPKGMTGWAEVLVAEAAASTNAATIYEVKTWRGAGTNATLQAVSPYCPPLTNRAAVAVLRFPSAAVGSNIVFVTTALSPTNTVRSAVLRYAATYP